MEVTVETVKERSATMLITPQAQALLHSAMQLTQESEETVLTQALKFYVEQLKKSAPQPAAWLKEARQMAKNPQKYKAYTDLDEMFEDILR